MNEKELATLLSLPRETEWIEFKENNADPEDIGEYISAIANAAALHDKEVGFIVWGLSDSPVKVVGTTFRPRTFKVGNEELENWLAIHLSPRVNFRVHESHSDGQSLVIFEIPAATHTPVRFKDNEYIRVGTYKKRLREHPEKERDLWAIFSRLTFENGLAKRDASPDEILSLLDYPRYFELTNQPLPDSRSGIIERLVSERLIAGSVGGVLNITNLGAILFPKNLDEFESLSRKAVRVVVYKGPNRVETLREQGGRKGYASGFESLIEFINAQLPQNEHIGKALRKEVRMYPELAIRELVANALIHQDFTISGTGPMIEIFSDRIEITNPGTPLIDSQRFLDLPPRSRNDRLAAFMRRVNICEERGSGIDKVITVVEAFQLPAPLFTVTESHTKAVLFAHKPFATMDKNDRIRACYQHAGLRWVSNQRMTNTSLRQRFGISEENYSMASRIISDTIEAGLIKQHDPTNTSKKLAQYVPFWA